MSCIFDYVSPQKRRINGNNKGTKANLNFKTKTIRFTSDIIELTVRKVQQLTCFLYVLLSQL